MVKEIIEVDTNTVFNYGKYPGTARYHLDQVPADFSQYGKASYNDIGEGSCWILQPAVDMTKRQHTLQLAFRADGPQIMPPAVIFQGVPRKTNKKLKSVEERLPMVKNFHWWTIYQWQLKILSKKNLASGHHRCL